MTGYDIGATDGNLGKVDEFYFNDESWTIRYVVVETGNWLKSVKSRQGWGGRRKQSHHKGRFLKG